MFQLNGNQDLSLACYISGGDCNLLNIYVGWEVFIAALPPPPFLFFVLPGFSPLDLLLFPLPFVRKRSRIIASREDHSTSLLCSIELDYFHSLLIPLANLDSVTCIHSGITFESGSHRKADTDKLKAPQR